MSECEWLSHLLIFDIKEQTCDLWDIWSEWEMHFEKYILRNTFWEILETNFLNTRAPSFLTNSLGGEHYDCHTQDLLQNFLNEAGIFLAHSESFVTLKICYNIFSESLSRSRFVTKFSQNHLSHSRFVTKFSQWGIGDISSSLRIICQSYILMQKYQVQFITGKKLSSKIKWIKQ